MKGYSCCFLAQKRKNVLFLNLELMGKVTDVLKGTSSLERVKEVFFSRSSSSEGRKRLLSVAELSIDASDLVMDGL